MTSNHRSLNQHLLNLRQQQYQQGLNSAYHSGMASAYEHGLSGDPSAPGGISGDGIYNEDFPFGYEEMAEPSPPWEISSLELSNLGDMLTELNRLAPDDARHIIEVCEQLPDLYQARTQLVMVNNALTKLHDENAAAATVTVKAAEVPDDTAATKSALFGPLTPDEHSQMNMLISMIEDPTELEAAEEIASQCGIHRDRVLFSLLVAADTNSDI